MSHKPVAKPAEPRGQFALFIVRLLLLLVAAILVSITVFQFAWSRRSVQASVVSSAFDISLLEPHLDLIAEQSHTIGMLQCDLATNSIMIQAQSRHLEAASREIESIVADPSAFLASLSLGITMQEARELVDDR